MTLEDALKARGYSESELEGLKPMLENAKFRSAIEASLTSLETERNSFKGEAEGWDKWYNETALPKLEGALKGEQDARSELGAAQARLKTLEDQGFVKPSSPTEAPKPEEKKAEPGLEPGKKYVSYEDAGKMLEAEGVAIATASDIAAEYQELYGSSLFTYKGPDGSRGMEALRREAKASRKDLRAYVAEKFKFQEKWAEKESQALKAREDAIRKDEREKTVAELANPEARVPQGSLQPFLPKPKSEGKGTFPWERPEGENTTQRLTRAFTNLHASRA